MLGKKAIPIQPTLFQAKATGFFPNCGSRGWPIGIPKTRKAADEAAQRVAAKVNKKKTLLAVLLKSLKKT